MNIGILGLGEVGQAIKKLCQPKHQVYVRDLSFDEIKKKPIDILHICIPYNKIFNSVVKKTIDELKPQLTIINSTVKPGTTKALYQKTKAKLVHAPIIGIHPHLYSHLKIFTKPLGAVNKSSYQLAKKHFNSLGVKTTRFKSPLESELAKILSTTYYAWNILFEKWVHKLCTKTQTDFDQVYTQWNQIYNTGYKNSKPNVIRPILKHQPGPIGGHCLIPNAEILNLWLSDSVTKFILSQNNKAK